MKNGKVSQYAASSFFALWLLMAGAESEARTTSNFGVRVDPFTHHGRMHQGMDMSAPMGTLVYATGDGWVVRSGWASGYGNLVEMAHGHGFITRFGHLSQLDVRQGDFVRRGQLIGRVGTTGRSTGPHLHYEVRVNGQAVNPAGYMQIVFDSPPDRSVLAVAQRQLASVPQAGRIAVQSGHRARGHIELATRESRDKWEEVSDYSALVQGHVTPQ